ncbi:CocE/NonD family hydrolase [Heyndrickxia sp. NPDC080065]|uniref:CocE/NonD family hydrolase n=1 Tax=Heyndrickxia sp. NPDC080065 TaxID=3390568 RepID=UPI003D090654
MEFLYYCSGILHAKIIIGDRTEIQYVNKNIDSCVFSLDRINNILHEGKNFKWTEQKSVQLKSGEHFQRYQKVSDSTWIYVMSNGKQPIDLVVDQDRIVAFLYHEGVESAVMVEQGFEHLTPIGIWKDDLLSPAEYDVNHLGKIDVMMRDGVKLATEVWLPKDLPQNKRIPAVLIRTPYGRMKYGLNKLRFVQRGFAVISQDVRGREDSEGEWLPMYHEINDGDDTLNWIATQGWSDGNVGMIGSSYSGFVQWAAAASGNPHLKAIISIVTAGSPFGDIPRQKGIYSSGLMAWIFMMAKQRTNRDAMNRDDWDEVLNVRPIKDIPQKALGSEIPFWDEWMEHPDYDEFWASFDWTRFGQKINVPALYISGWYDDDGNGTTEAWELNQQHRRANQRLILGPWYHNSNATREIHNVQFGLNAIRYDLDLLCQRWYDRFLKGIENGVEKESTVEFYTVGANEWKKADCWPPENASFTNLYLHSNGNAQTSLGDGVLENKPSLIETSDHYVFDPKNPAPYLIDVSENECSVPENYRDVEMRNDVLVYTSQPLEEDLEIAGDILAVIYAASSAKDTDWLVRLTDVNEAGDSIRLSDGIIRARYRNSYEKPKLLEPDRIESYEIKMSKIAHLFKKGHRIRVAITSGAKNAIFPNHNTGNDPAADTDFAVAQQTVYHSREYPSHVRLPVVKK